MDPFSLVVGFVGGAAVALVVDRGARLAVIIRERIERSRSPIIVP